MAAERILEQLVARSEETDRALRQQSAQMVQLMEHLKSPPPVTFVPSPPNVDAVRKEKIQNLILNIRKSNRLKPFKGNSDSDIELFLKKFTEELNTIKVLVGLNNDLTRDEYVPLFRSCLEYPVVERVNQVLVAKDKTWANVTIEELKSYMKTEFGSRQTDVANVLKQFGPSRLTKRKDETAADHYFRFNQNIPECMKPVTAEEKDRYIDLINRSMYFISLEDEYLQKELSDMKAVNPNIKTYFDEIVSAEGRLKAFNDITKSSTATEGSGITVSYLNSKTGNKASFGNKGNKT